MKRILKVFAVLIFATLLVSAFSQSSKAQNSGSGIKSAPDIMPIIPPVDGSAGFLGQNHKYSIVFRGNGEAVVSLRVAFTNKTDSDLKVLKFRVPKGTPTDIIAFQVIKEKVCVRYDVSVYDPVTRSYKQPKCLEYQDPDYYQDYYSNSKYQKAKFVLDLDDLEVSLPLAVAPNKTGAIFIYFRTFAYAKKNVFGAFDYTFETLKVEDPIQSLNIGISPDSDLVMKGTTGQVQYRSAAPMISGIGGGAEGVAVKSSDIDNYLSQIGYGVINKSASSLAPLDSYTVKGSYASNRAKLYGKEISIMAVVLLVLVFLVSFLTRKIIKKLNAGDERGEVKSESGMTTAKSSNPRLYLISLGISFICSILMTGYTLLLILFFRLFNTSPMTSDIQTVFSLFLVVFSFALYSLLLFGPALYLGIKKGVGYGIACVILTIVWLAFYMLLLILVMFLFGFSLSGMNPVTLPNMMKAY